MATDLGEPSTLLMEPNYVSMFESSQEAEPLGQSDPTNELAAEIPLRDAEATGVSESMAWFRDFVELTKPRIVTMILVTTVASAWIAMASKSLVVLSAMQWLMLLIGTGLVAGSAGAANQVWERVIDTLMPRTASRPIASGRMPLWVGVAFMTATGLVGTALLAWSFGAMPATFGAATWLLYVLVYTPMKTRTAWNTTVGAIAGALPVFIGYTAAGGTTNDLAGWMLFGVLAAWQYPHFMAIAWLYRRQYGEAGFQMTTTVEPTGHNAAWQSILGTIALAACGITLCLAPTGQWWFSVAGIVTSILVIVACAPLLKASLRFRSQPDDVRARKMLRWSLVVLPAVLLVMTLRMIGL